MASPRSSVRDRVSPPSSLLLCTLSLKRGVRRRRRRNSKAPPPRTHTISPSTRTGRGGGSRLRGAPRAPNAAKRRPKCTDCTRERSFTTTVCVGHYGHRGPPRPPHGKGSWRGDPLTFRDIFVKSNRHRAKTARATQLGSQTTKKRQMNVSSGFCTLATYTSPYSVASWNERIEGCFGVGSFAPRVGDRDRDCATGQAPEHRRSFF